MAIEFKMNLHLFEGDGGAGAASGPAGEGGGEAAVTPGVLADGTQVDDRLAARLEAQAKKRKARGEQPVRMQQAPEPQAQDPQPQEMSLDDEWAEAKKGKYKEQYARDVKAAIQDRFKNQKDAEEQLAKIMPAMQLLAKQWGIDENDTDAIVSHIRDDDSLYEEEADRMGMTVDTYRDYLALKEENERLKQHEAQEAEDMFFQQHLQKLAMQAEELKKKYPNFDLRTELQNETFRDLTAPNSGVNVETAYFAVHHDELAPQMMAYGIQRAQQQISQTIQANRGRPVEGASRSGSQPASIAVDPRKMTREERQRLIERARRGETIVL